MTAGDLQLQFLPIYNTYHIDQFKGDTVLVCSKNRYCQGEKAGKV